MPKEADVPPQQGKPEKGAGEKNDEKKVEPFHLREKIEEMVDYGYPLTMSFPRKDRELADELKKIHSDDLPPEYRNRPQIF